jgi:hypothetical protein
MQPLMVMSASTKLELGLSRSRVASALIEFDHVGRRKSLAMPRYVQSIRIRFCIVKVPPGAPYLHNMYYYCIAI